jgi:uncharacterized protein YecE (DUF72 family)
VAGKKQLGLFAPSVVEPAVDDKAAAIATWLPKKLYFGTSSWTFPGWASVYAGKPTEPELVESGLAAYAAHPLLRIAGIDRSHYGPLSREDLSAYAEQLPPGFKTLSKVWDERTILAYPDHPRYAMKRGAINPRFLDAASIVDEVLAPYADVFMDHTGPFVFELAPMPREWLPSPGAFAERLDKLLSALPRTFRYAFELRNRELLSRDYFEALRAHGASHVFNYWTFMPTVGEQLALPGSITSDFVVARLLIPPGERYEEKRAEYKPFDAIKTPQLAMREDMIALAARALRKECEVFAIVGNLPEGSAPLTIRAIAEEIARRRARASRA